MKLRLLTLLLMLIAGRITAQTTVHTFTHGGITRSFRVYLPPMYTGATAVPLVFNLHGYTSNAQQQEFYSGMNTIADTANFILCYPDGLNNSWNSGFTSPYNGGVDDVGFISRLIDTLSAWHNIDPARVFSCGMSNGGFMSYRLACDLENRIAAIASVTGSMSPLQKNNCSASRPVPVMEVHGTLDGTVPYNGAAGMLPIDSVLSFWRGINACTATVVVTNLPDIAVEGSTVATYQYGGCAANTEVLHYKVTNGGHTWPGAFPVTSLGITNQDIKASDEIWRFFYKYVHPAPLLTAQDPARNTPISLSPNPFQNEFSFRQLPLGAELSVVNTAGQRVFAGTCTDVTMDVDARSWPAGVYLVRVRTEAGTQVMRVVKLGE